MVDMKRLICITLAILAIGMQLYAVNEDVVTWEQILKDVNTDEQRIAIILKIMEFKDKDFTPILVSTLEKIANKKTDTVSATATYNQNILARLIIQELGNLKSGDSAELIFRMYDESTDALVKSEAARSLGKMRATQYAERLAVDLASLNLAPIVASSKNQEILALALVQSLTVMRSPIGYEPVFLAAQGWYSSFSRVKDTAKASMLTMLDDPSASLIDILTKNPSLEIKLTALDTLMSSKAPAEKKIDGATKGLKIAIERASTNVTENALTSKLRVNTMVALIGLEDHSTDNVPLYMEVIKMDKKNDASLDETLKAYVALGVNGTDDAAKYLVSTLSEYNSKEKSKANTVRDKSLIRQIIASLVLTKNPLVKNILSQSQFIDYDASIKNVLKDANAKFSQ